MLIRFSVNNYLSFGEEREFNLLSSPRYSRLGHHRYNFDGLDILKLSAIYGANGSGKSNLIRSLGVLTNIVNSGELPTRLNSEKFKLSGKNTLNSQIFTIEFFKNGIPYLYGIEINNNVVLTEELYRSGLGRVKDTLVFERKTDSNGKTKTLFSTEFEKDKESLTLKNVIEKTLSKPEKSIFKLLSELDNEFLNEIKKPFEWFQKDLVLLTPTTKPRALAHNLDSNSLFKDFVNNTMCTFDTGIKKVETETKTIKEFFGEDKENIDRITSILKDKPSGIMGISNNLGEEIIAVNENGELLIKRIVLLHQDDNERFIKFYLHEESDGTNRLLDYIPAFQEIISKNKVYLIDEVERSIHPLLIKELVKKFSSDINSKGQLIFTTHESNLLDQDIFRQDEIWFIEKDKYGCSDLYPLSEFKEHHTKDIKKGYLNGRYGAIPFLGNLKDLNWQEYGSIE